MDDAGPHFLSEQALQQIFIERQRTLRKDRITELLKLVQNLVIESRIVMIGPPSITMPMRSSHSNSSSTSRALLRIRLVFFERLESGLDCALVFLATGRKRIESREHLKRQQLPVLEIQHRVDVSDLAFREDIVLLREAALTVSGHAVTVGQAFDP